jgi:hypothetical protein
MSSFDDLFCLACGEEMAEPLRWTASLRCHDCMETGEPISVELVLRARGSASRRRVAEDIHNHDAPPERTAA